MSFDVKNKTAFVTGANRGIGRAIVEEALQRAKDALEEKISDEEIAAVEATILKSMAQLNLKRRRRRSI